MLKEIHLAGSARTPFGSFCGAFADVSPVELGKAAVERSGVKPEGSQRIPRGGTSSAAPTAQTSRCQPDRGGASSAAEWQSQWNLN